MHDDDSYDVQLLSRYNDPDNQHSFFTNFELKVLSKPLFYECFLSFTFDCFLSSGGGKINQPFRLETEVLYEYFNKKFRKKFILKLLNKFNEFPR